MEDPWTSEFLKYKELGYSHEEVGMALGALGPDADQDSQVRPMTQWAPCETSNLVPHGPVGVLRCSRKPAAV